MPKATNPNSDRQRILKVLLNSATPLAPVGIRQILQGEDVANGNEAGSYKYINSFLSDFKKHDRVIHNQDAGTYSLTETFTGEFRAALEVEALPPEDEQSSIIEQDETAVDVVDETVLQDETELVPA